MLLSYTSTKHPLGTVTVLCTSVADISEPGVDNDYSSLQTFDVLVSQPVKTMQLWDAHHELYRSYCKITADRQMSSEHDGAGIHQRSKSSRLTPNADAH